MSALSTARARRVRGPAPDGVRDHLRLVPASRSRLLLRSALAAIALGGAAVFGAVALDALAAGDAVRTAVLETRVAEAERDHAALVAEVAGLENPARIRDAATALGMITAEDPRYLFPQRSLPADGTASRTVGPGRPADPLKPTLADER